MLAPRHITTQELKKKELEDLDAVFAELGISVAAKAAADAAAAAAANGESKRKKKDKKKSPEGAEGAAQTAAAAAPEEPASEEPGSEDVDEAGAPLDPAAVRDGRSWGRERKANQGARWAVWRT